MIASRFLRSGLVAATAALAVGLWPSVPAKAAFPGSNGLITFSASVPVTSKFFTMTDQIFVIAPDGQHLTRLTHSPKTDDVNPSFDASGRQIVFDRAPLGPGHGSIWVMNANGSHQKQLTKGFVGGASFSPNGKLIVFDRSVGSGLAQVWVMSANGTHQRRLTSTLQNSEAVYTPSGKQIVFVRDNTTLGTRNIWIMNANGTDQAALTSGGNDDNPSVSPDGKEIVFVHPSAGGLSGIWVMGINGKNARLLVSPGQGGLGNSNPCFSPDGKKIAFWSERHGKGQIWTANANGSGQKQLTHGSMSPLTPNWGRKPG